MNSLDAQPVGRKAPLAIATAATAAAATAKVRPGEHSIKTSLMLHQWQAQNSQMVTKGLLVLSRCWLG